MKSSRVAMTYMNIKSVRTVKRIERPRPLKLSGDVIAKNVNLLDIGVTKRPISDVWNDLEASYMNLSDCNYDENTANEISKICQILKNRGEELDLSNRSRVDQYYVGFRNASREDRLDMISRLKLLEVIELRSMKWQTNENLVIYYDNKISELEGKDKIPPLISPPIAHNYSNLVPNQGQTVNTTISIPLAPGEILRSSGKFAKPTKIAGKNYFKDEVVIRNSDSGKVMGIKGRRVHMIEELSDTIISFQRVNPGARDRLVQITGPHEEAISHAKTLVEDTIRRNASPLREKTDLNLDNDCNRMMSSISFDDVQDFASKAHQLEHSYSMGDATLGEYVYKLHLGSDCITLSATNSEILKEAKLVLLEYFTESETSDKTIQYSQENRNNANLNNANASKLERSFSWMSSTASRASLSPFESSSEDEVFPIVNAQNDISDSSSNIPIRAALSIQNKSISDATLPSLIEQPTQSIFHMLEPGIPTILPPEPRKCHYTREELLHFQESPFSKNTNIKLNEEVIENHPFILRCSASIDGTKD